MKRNKLNKWKWERAYKIVSTILLVIFFTGFIGLKLYEGRTYESLLFGLKARGYYIKELNSEYVYDEITQTSMLHKDLVVEGYRVSVNIFKNSTEKRQFIKYFMGRYALASLIDYPIYYTKANIVIVSWNSIAPLQQVYGGAYAFQS